MSMIEKVARAIAANKRGLEPNDPAIDSKWQSYCGQARAAIEAMMEPTPEMVDAATCERGGRQTVNEATLATWQAMIDAALKDSQ